MAELSSKRVSEVSPYRGAMVALPRCRWFLEIER